MMDFILNGLINIIGKRIGYILLLFVIGITLFFDCNIKILIFNLIMLIIGLFVLKLNNKVL